MSDHSDSDSQRPPTDTDGLPFVAPCRDLDIEAPRRWLELHLADRKRAPGKSLTYGLATMVLFYVPAYVGFAISGPLVLLTILSGLTLVSALSPCR